MKVSIIIPFKNAEKWIQETIISIQNQDYANWEIIAVDDNSEDSTLDIVKTLAQSDNRILFFKNDESGIIPALQLALKHSTGDAITRMDADDLMPQSRLSVMISHLLKLPKKSIVTGKVKYISETKISDGYKKYESWLNERIDNNDHWEHLYRECVIASPNWLVRKSDLIQHAIFDNLNYPEDYDMCFHWQSHSFTINPIQETTLFWREHPYRTSRNSDIYQQESFFNLKVNWFVKNFQQKSIAILGAGTKGKLIANKLIELSTPFSWYDWQAEKYRAGLLNKKILPMDKFDAPNLLLVAFVPSDQKEFDEWCNHNNFKLGKNLFLV